MSSDSDSDSNPSDDNEDEVQDDEDEEEEEEDDGRDKTTLIYGNRDVERLYISYSRLYYYRR